MKKHLRSAVACILAVMMSAIGVNLAACTDKKEQLSTPDGGAYSAYTLSWKAVDGADGYKVSVKKGSETAISEKTVKSSSLDVSSLSAGDYSANIIAYAANKKDSAAYAYAFTVVAPLTALATPTSFDYADGKVTWGAVEHAENGYSVKIVLKSDGSEVVAAHNVSVPETNVADLAAGAYTANVTANKVSGKYTKSIEAAFDFTVAAKNVKLATPSGAQINAEDRKLTWNCVENATSYEVKITASGAEVINATVSVCEISISDVETGEFTAKIVAVGGEGYDNSEEYSYNGKITAVKLAAPSSIAANADQTQLSWTAVADSDAYRLIVKSDETVVIVEELIETSYDISALGKGDYKAVMTTLANPDDVFRTDSEQAEQTFTVSSLGAFAAIEKIEIDGGYLVWTEAGAINYEVKVTEKGADQALSINNVKPVGNKLMIAASALPSGGYTVTVTPSDNRHDTETGASASYDFSITEVKTFTAEDISKFDGGAPIGEHASVSLVDHNGKNVAKVVPTADGWGRIGSPAVTVNYDLNSVLFIDVEDIEVGGFHCQIQVDGTNYKVLDDGAKLQDVALSLKNIEKLSGTYSSVIRLGVDNSSTTTANDAAAYYNSCRVLAITEYKDAFEGKLASVTNFRISNGMDVTWNAVDNADAYRVTLRNNDTDEVIVATTAQDGISYSARDLNAGNYKITVTAYNTANEKAIESDAASYSFKVTYLANYTAKQIGAFDKTLLNDEIKSGKAAYDSENNVGKLNPDGDYGWGAVGPETAVSVNLANEPFAVVDVASIHGGYLVRGLWTENEKASSLLVLRNDTSVTLDDTKLYIELWKKADQNGAPVYGQGLFIFGMGFIGNTVIALKGIKLVEVTEIAEITEGSKTPLAAPTSAKEEKGMISATPVKGNAAYTPKYYASVSDANGTKVSEQTNLSAPQVFLPELNLVSGSTYTVTFKAIGDDNYFSDSPVYTIDVTYEEVFALTDFSALDYKTNAAKKGGETVVTFDNGALVSSVANGGWGYDFFNIDVSAVAKKLQGCYLEWNIDLEKSTASANIATRFIKDGNVVGTGWGDSTVTSAFLTKEWDNKITDGIIWFAFGQGGASVEGATTKTVVLKSMKFVKYTIA